MGFPVPPAQRWLLPLSGAIIAFWQPKEIKRLQGQGRHELSSAALAEGRVCLQPGWVFLVQPATSARAQRSARGSQSQATSEAGRDVLRTGGSLLCPSGLSVPQGGHCTASWAACSRNSYLGEERSWFLCSTASRWAALFWTLLQSVLCAHSWVWKAVLAQPWEWDTFLSVLSRREGKQVGLGK